MTTHVQAKAQAFVPAGPAEGRLRLAILGSGSSGNASVIWGPEGPILIDAGLSGRQITQRLRVLGLAVSDLRAVLLTHEHSDHTKGLDQLARQAPELPICCTSHTRVVLTGYATRSVQKWRVVEAGSRCSVGGLQIECFSVPHDAVDPVGFVLEHPEGGRIGYASDLGHAPESVVQRLKDCDALYLEANYCPMLLAQDARRPWSLKQRIASRHGHLSNQQAAEIIKLVGSSRLQIVIAGHLSSDCNKPSVAEAVLQEALASCGLSRVALHCATQDGVLGPFPIELSGPKPRISRSQAAPPAAPLMQMELDFG